jgi:hypothetical protein
MKLNFAICVLLATSALASCGPSPDQKAIAASELAVKNSLTDPNSAEFEGELVFQHPITGFSVCGRVNAKNTFGGYIGYRWFYATFDSSVDTEPSDVAVADTEDMLADVDFAKKWLASCTIRKTSE